MPSLNFKGKALVQNYHLLVPYHELKPVKAESLSDKVSLHDNLVIHGDNLKALTLMRPSSHPQATPKPPLSHLKAISKRGESARIA